MNTFSRLNDVLASHCEFPEAEDGTREVSLHILQSLQVGPVSVGRSVSPVDESSHHFDLLTPLHEARDTGSRTSLDPATHARLDLPPAMPVVSHNDSPCLLLARLYVIEVPCEEGYEKGFSSLLEGRSPSLGFVGAIADELIIERELARDLSARQARQGSLYVLDRIDVHPAVRGQGLALVLAGEAVRRLITSSFDYVLGHAQPVPSLFREAEDEADRKDRSIDRLMDYYARAGFEPIEPRNLPEHARNREGIFFRWPDIG